MIYSAYYGSPVLITGGCGFIGSFLAEQLVASGAQVTIIDDLSSGSLDNIVHIKKHINFIHASIENLQACIDATREKTIIFHLAAQVSVPESAKDPQKCFHTNTKGTFNILEAARLNHAARIIFSSSSAVYGNTELPCTEDVSCNPTSPYGFSKRIGELLCQQYSFNYDIPTVILRYFNVYGPRQNPRGAYAAVVAKFAHSIKNNEPITVFGDGKQTRDFVRVEEVVAANAIFGYSQIRSSDIYNIASGHSISIIDLIDHIRQKFPHYNKKIVFTPPRPGDLKNSIADVSKYYDFLKRSHPTLYASHLQHTHHHVADHVAKHVEFNL